MEFLKKSGLLPPRFLKLAVTGACNLHCRHCWPDSGPGRGKPVPARQVARLVREFAKLGGTEVSITGGEPLTHPQWREIVADACAHAALTRIELQTNATLIESSSVQFFRDLDPDRFILRVSLDGATAATNDDLRGTGSFERTVAALGEFAAAGLADQVVLSLTETEHNFEEIPELLELAERYSVPRAETATLLPRGRAAKGTPVEPPHPHQVAALVQRYQRDPEFRRRYDTRGCTAAVEWARWSSHPRTHHCTFVENPFVDVHGRLFPCAMYEREEAAVTGVFERPLVEALQEGAPVWGRLRRRSQQRLSVAGPCAGCVGWQHCRGGCFGRGVEDDPGTPSGEDRCALRRAVYESIGTTTDNRR